MVKSTRIFKIVNLNFIFKTSLTKLSININKFIIGNRFLQEFSYLLTILNKGKSKGEVGNIIVNTYSKTASAIFIAYTLGVFLLL